MVLYGDLTKEEVLCALYNNAKAQGIGIFMFVPGELTTEQARKLLNQRSYFDYLAGRVLKVDLSGDEGFDESLYDRDNGEGTAQKAIDDYAAAQTIKP